MENRLMVMKLCPKLWFYFFMFWWWIVFGKITGTVRKGFDNGAHLNFFHILKYYWQDIWRVFCDTFACLPGIYQTKIQKLTVDIYDDTTCHLLASSRNKKGHSKYNGWHFYEVAYWMCFLTLPLSPKNWTVDIGGL